MVESILNEVEGGVGEEVGGRAQAECCTQHAAGRKVTLNVCRERQKLQHSAMQEMSTRATLQVLNGSEFSRV